MPWLHAWVEYLGEDLSWRVADASDRIGYGAADDGVAPSVVAVADDGGSAEAPTVASRPEVAVGIEPSAEPTAAPAEATTTTGTDAPVEPASAPAAREPTVAEPGPLARIAAFDRAYPWVLRAVPIGLLVLAAWLLLGGRMRRATTLDDSADLSRLLQGVLQQPGAFGHVAALFHRPLVPLSDGAAISLHRARELASSGRLYRTRTRAGLAAQAIRSGAAVLDDRTPEGTTVADALGAVDIDRWSSMLERSSSDRTLAAVNAALRERGEDWCIRVATEVASGMAVLDLAPLGARLPGVRATRLVLFDATDPVLVRAAGMARQSPRAAVLLALDHVAGRLGLTDDRRGHLLAGAARAAVLENFGR
jgi:hypothetical protein